LITNSQLSRSVTTKRRGATVFFMVIERYKNRDAKAVYARFRGHGRMMPEGLKYEFEILPVMTSAEAVVAALKDEPPGAG
jgi:hypothetical protein